MVLICNCHSLRYALISPCSWSVSLLDEFNRLRMRLKIRLEALQSRRWLAETSFSLAALVRCQEAHPHTRLERWIGRMRDTWEWLWLVHDGLLPSDLMCSTSPRQQLPASISFIQRGNLVCIGESGCVFSSAVDFAWTT